MITKEEIAELEARLIADDDQLPKSLEWLKERQPDLFEWLTHHFNTEKSSSAKLGVALFAVILLERDIAGNE